MRIRQVAHRSLRVNGTKPNLLNIPSVDPSTKLSLNSSANGCADGHKYTTVLTLSATVVLTNLSFQPVRESMVLVAGRNEIRVLRSEGGKAWR